jgi:exopolyphosphatase/guanosine-5'-triphosphate,3'-diphosphate pyrophosphatase
VTHTHLPGFSAGDQQVLAGIIRGHRRKLVPAVFAAVPAERVEFAQRLCALLRLAVLLNRSRSREDARVPEIAWKNGDVRLTFPEHWLERHPLTRADLEQEAGYLRAIGVRLKCRESRTRRAATPPDPARP